MSNLILKGLKDGLTTVNVINGSSNDSVGLEVVDEGFNIKSYDIKELLVGEFTRLWIERVNEDSSRYGVITWEVDHPEILSVAPNWNECTLQGLTKGVANVTFKWVYENEIVYKKSISITVKEVEPTPATSISIYLPSTEGVPGVEKEVTFSSFPVGSSVSNMKWTTTPEGIVEIEKGYLKCIAPGVATISLEADGLTATSQRFTVKEAKDSAPTSIKVKPAYAITQDDGSYKLSPKLGTSMTFEYTLPEGIEEIERHLKIDKIPEIVELGELSIPETNNNKAILRFTTIRPGSETLVFRSVKDDSVSAILKLVVTEDRIVMYNYPEEWEIGRTYLIKFVSETTGSTLDIDEISSSEGIRTKKVSRDTYEITVDKLDKGVPYIYIRAERFTDNLMLFNNIPIKVKGTPSSITVTKPLPVFLNLERGQPLSLNIKTEQKNIDFFWSTIGTESYWDHETVGMETGESTLAIPFVRYELEPFILLRMVNRDTKESYDTFCSIYVKSKITPR